MSDEIDIAYVILILRRELEAERSAFMLATDNFTLKTSCQKMAALFAAIERYTEWAENEG